ncbi:hypothetical protein [Halegenticoccus tardaugens]|uniref:hypothetical protein n=1 Tax=Halegenticoccus tardaugens TaxID=2071624 RepID=UPI0013E984B7|nr:hypothetical protein [Halegenticoccus tardaugens]
MGDSRPLAEPATDFSAEYVLVRRRDLAVVAVEAAIVGAFAGYTAARLVEP